jgi:hypothetical protein
MTTIGRNAMCPCGSGIKFKRCCQNNEEALAKEPLSRGQFRFEPGSYGGPGRVYMPSIICYKETASEVWESHFCLVNPEAVIEGEDAASRLAREHLDDAQAILDKGGSPQDFAWSLRHRGYLSVSDYGVVCDKELMQ